MGDRAENCTAHDNTGRGIVTGTGSILAHCIAYGNAGTAAIEAGSGSALNNRRRKTTKLWRDFRPFFVSESSEPTAQR